MVACRNCPDADHALRMPDLLPYFKTTLDNRDHTAFFYIGFKITIMCFTSEAFNYGGSDFAHHLGLIIQRKIH